MLTTPSVAPLSPSTSDEKLIAAVRCGDDRAFEELHRRYRGRVGGYVFSLVGDHGKAEDITQEIFISALRRLRVTDRPILFRPWIFEIAKNACIDQSRRARRNREVSLEVEPEPAGNRSHIRLAADPDVAITHKQELKDLCGAFGTLSDTHHQVLVMRELEGRSYAEIAYKLGMTVPVVESTLFRARRKLGEEYDEIASGRRCEQVCAAVASIGRSSVRTIGARERRRLARHLSHCDPCRREALLVGFDLAGLQPQRISEKIAALIPIPWLAKAIAGKRNAAGSGAAAHSTGALRWMDRFTQMAERIGPGVGAGKAVAGLAALVTAGVGGGIATHVISISGSTGAVATAAPVHGSTGARAAHHSKVAANGLGLGRGVRTSGNGVSPGSSSTARSGAAVAASRLAPTTIVVPTPGKPGTGTSGSGGGSPSSGTASGTDKGVALGTGGGSGTGTGGGSSAGTGTGSGTGTGGGTGTVSGTGTGTGGGTSTGTGGGTSTGTGGGSGGGTGGKTHGHGQPNTTGNGNGYGNGGVPGNGGVNTGGASKSTSGTTGATGDTPAATSGSGTSTPTGTPATVTTPAPGTGGSTHH